MTEGRIILPEDFLFKTTPFDHQRQVFLRSRDEVNFAYLMGMGTGKTKVTIDVAAWNYQMGRIQFLVVLAPNGVHANWITKELPAHMPDWTNCISATWASYLRKKEQMAVDAVMDPDHEGMRVLAFNLEAFKDATRCKGALLIRKITNSFKAMMAVDESSKIKTPGAKRTAAIINLGKRAEMRRILTGTPVTNGPLDIYSQFSFLDRELLGFDNFQSFKHYYSEWEKESFYNKAKGEMDTYEALVGYRNIDELTDAIDRHSFRITKEECLDLPPKVYQTRYVEMSVEQRRLYNEIIKESMMSFEDDEELTVNNVLSKMLRLQQVLGGFVPREEFGDAEPVDGPNVRLRALMDVLTESEGKVIIWARFRAELAAIENAIRKEFGKDSVVSYHGGVSKEDRAEGMISFQDKESPVRFFVGQQHSGGYGLTLHAATTVVYYSNDFSLEARLQSEDRAHRIGQDFTVLYIDFECMGTIDTKILLALREKMNLADMVTRDSKRITGAEGFDAKKVDPTIANEYLAIAKPA